MPGQAFVKARQRAGTTGDMAERLVIGTAEAARLLGLSRSALYQRVARGTVPGRKFGRRLVFVRDELEGFVRRLPLRRAS